MRSRACAVSTLRASRPAGAPCSGGAPQRTCRSTSCCGFWPIGCRRRCTATWTRRAFAALDRLAKTGSDKSAPLPQASSVRPGTLLVREWDGVLHRVMALDQGFAWNGTSYRSLSEVARAITGTRWNGPRFFGLREVS